MSTTMKNTNELSVNDSSKSTVFFDLFKLSLSLLISSFSYSKAYFIIRDITVDLNLSLILLEFMICILLFLDDDNDKLSIHSRTKSDGEEIQTNISIELEMN